MSLLSFTLLPTLFIGCQSIEQPIVWEGYAFEQTSDGMVPLRGAMVELMDKNGVLIGEGTTPAGRQEHFLRLILEEEMLNQPIELRVSSPTTTPILWNGISPSTSGTWLAGGLFSIEEAFGFEFLNTFADTVDIELTGSIHLWGEPFRSEEWTDVVITLSDEVQDYPIYTFSQLPNGLISTNTESGIDWFFAWNLPATTLFLRIETSDGQMIETIYHPEEGDILSALYYALPPKETTP